jgi:DNA-directed RNA polymerase specialized sigma24 family protein
MPSAPERLEYGSMAHLTAAQRTAIWRIRAAGGAMPRPMNWARRPGRGEFLNRRPGAPSWLTAPRHVDPGQPDPSLVLEHAEEMERLWAAVEDLPVHQRDAVVSWLWGMTLEAEGRRANVTREAVRLRRIRALEALRDVLSDDEKGVSDGTA